MTTPANQLGRLETVDLRKVWPSEAGDFTPWLAQPENIGLLADAIGLELEIEAWEKDVGPFRADIVCRETATDNWVLIENQLERTDHVHLGQLLTYAAGLKAVTIVWVAERFTDEHRAALDWLNDITDERFNFFGLEIELWRIGGSDVAPKFNIVSEPNDWTKAARQTSTTRDPVRLEYWESFRSLVLRTAPELTPRKAHDRAALRFSTSRRRIDLRVQAARVDGGRISVGLAVRGSEAQTLFGILKRHQEEIEAELGVPVEWREQPTINVYHLRTIKPAQLDDRAEWPSQHEWLLEKLRLFHRVLSPRIATFPVGDITDPDVDIAAEDDGEQ